MRIVLTHSEGRFEGLAAALDRRGHEVRHAPLVRTRARSGDAVREEAEALLALPWIVFTSRSAVEAWRALGLPWHSPDAPQDDLAPLIGAIGRKTASALRRAGASVALIGDRAQATSLAGTFLDDPRAAGPVGLPQGDRALPTLRRALEREGFETRPLVLYETVTEPFPEDAVAAAGQPEGGAAGAGATGGDAAGALVVLASPSAAGALPDRVGRSATLVAIGPTTAAAVERRGFACLRAASPSVAGVLAAVDAMAAEGVTADGAAPQGHDRPRSRDADGGGRA